MRLTIAIALLSIALFSQPPAYTQQVEAEVVSQKAPALVPPKVRTLRFEEGPTSREARVEIRCTVLANGKATNIETRDGFYDEQFARLAVSMMKSAKITPATLDGNAIDWEGFEVAFIFSRGSSPNRGVTSAFRKEAQKAVEMIEAKEFDQAHRQVEEMTRDTVKYVYEYAVLHVMLAETLSKVGQTPEAFYESRLATFKLGNKYRTFSPDDPQPSNSRGNYLLQEPLLSIALRSRFASAASLGMAVEALEAASELQGLAPLAADDPVASEARSIRARLASREHLISSAEIVGLGWFYTPYRRRFTVQKVRGGEIDTILVGCETKTRTLKFQSDVEWTLPASWGRCWLHFKGQAGTQFQIVEPGGPL